MQIQNLNVIIFPLTSTTFSEQRSYYAIKEIKVIKKINK